MVGSTSPRSVLPPPLVADTAGAAGDLENASSGALAPRRRRRRRRSRRRSWADRAVVVVVRARSGLMAAHSVTAGDISANNSIASLSLSGGRTASSSPVPATLAPSVHSTAAAVTTSTRAPASVPVLAITCGAVGGVVALAVILALVYVRRIRRRVKSMKRRTNVLGPELAAPMPMSPSQSSSPLTIDSSRATLDGTMRIVSPRKASDLTHHLPPLRTTSLVGSPTGIEHPSPSIPLSPVRPQAVIIGLPPAAAARRSVIPSRDPRSPIRSSHATVPWPLVTPSHRSLSGPQRGPSTSFSDTSESHTH